MKTRILVLGASGMLGNAVVKHFENNPNFLVTKTNRSINSHSKNSIRFDASIDNVHTLSIDYDYVLNCIGIITPFIAKDPVSSIKVNALFPHELSNHCSKNGMKLIHITTDCVYSGNKGKYIESDLHDALDFYGKSKSLGECSNNAMVLRTSIIGEEIGNFVSLLSWAKSQANKSVDGYANHLWNGVTTPYYAKICENIITNDLYENGLFHVFAADDVSKYQLLTYFNKRYSLNININKVFPQAVDRTLRSEKKLCKKLALPTVSDMILNL